LDSKVRFSKCNEVDRHRRKAFAKVMLEGHINFWYISGISTIISYMAAEVAAVLFGDCPSCESDLSRDLFLLRGWFVGWVVLKTDQRFDSCCTLLHCDLQLDVPLELLNF
jgi:hypothetical protein